MYRVVPITKRGNTLGGIESEKVASASIGLRTLLLSPVYMLSKNNYWRVVKGYHNSIVTIGTQGYC